MNSTFIAAVRFVLEREGRILLSRRHDPGTEMHGLWELPGGRIEPREDPEEALAREAREELGVRIVRSRLFHAMTFVYNDEQPFIKLFYQACSPDEPAPRDEVSEIVWTDQAGAESRIVFPGIRDAIRAYYRLRSEGWNAVRP